MNFICSDILIGEHTFQVSYARRVSWTGEPDYWAALWPSAVALATYAASSPTSVKNKRCLEIGCGCGLAGLAAGRMGAEVTVTDCEEQALDLAGQNWEANHQKPEQLRILDWQHPAFRDSFDVILASDVLYNPKLFPSLVTLCSTFLSPEGEIWISEPGRPQASAFYGKMLQKGFRTDTHEVPVCLHHTSFQINVSRFY